MRAVNRIKVGMMSHENVLVTAWGVPKWINCHVLIIYYGSCFWVCFYFWLFFSESTGCVKFLLFFPHCLVEDAANTEEIHEKTWKVMRHDQTWLKKDEKHHIYKSSQGNPDDLKSQKINKPTTFNKNPTSATFKTVAFFCPRHEPALSWGPETW